jgi:O-acetyl-ADP-ribose deacetylase (regulator of RNase III)
MNPQVERVIDLAMELAPEWRAEVCRSLEPRMPALMVERGDITGVPADGLITAVNSRGMWAGAVHEEGETIHYRWVKENPCSVDGAIQCVAGGQYHGQAGVLLDRPEGETLVAGRQFPHKGAFDSVVFVVDDLKIPLYDLVTAGLTASDDAGLRSVTLPAFRTGVAMNRGGTWHEKVDDMARAACDFRARARNLWRITFVILEDREMIIALRGAIEKTLAMQSPGLVPRVKVQIGDITRVPVDGLITGINSKGAWGGGIDRVIAGVAGNQYHRSALWLIGKEECDTLVVKGQHPHGGAFRRVVFVVDDLQKPLHEILSAALDAADNGGLASVTVPAMRLGVMMGLGGPPEEKIADMAKAARDFQKRARNVKSVTFVIYGDPVTAEALQQELARIPEPLRPDM